MTAASFDDYEMAARLEAFLFDELEAALLQPTSIRRLLELQQQLASASQRREHLLEDWKHGGDQCTAT